MSRLPVLWALTSLAAGAFVLSLVLADVRPAVRAPAVLVFALLFPGLALVRSLDLSADRLTQLTLGVALSIVIAVLVPTGLLYLGVWSPIGMLVLLVVVTLGCVAGEAASSAVAARRSEAQSE